MTAPVDILQPGQQPAASSNTKPLWIAVGILGATVLAMGGTLLYKQSAPPPPATVAALAPAPATAALPQYPTARQPAVAASSNLADDLVEKPAAVAKPEPEPSPAKAPAPLKHVSKPAPAPSPAPHYSGAAPGYSAPTYSAPAQVAAAPVCAVCGSVESVTPIERSAKPAGVSVGTVAGGVLGAVLGNQIGHGNGRAAATVLGAVGGGFAGNAIEGKMRRETVYQVNVRMQNGSHRTFEAAHAPAVGSRVRVEGSTLRAD
ncbi:MAG: 17 kDa surface antigen [Polaromonas sp.]|nr:17 kDa surface antigen [Polaromonas sp.]